MSTETGNLPKTGISQQDHSIDEDLTNNIEVYLSEITITNKLLQKFQQLIAEMKSQTEALCEERISAEEIENRSASFFQAGFDEVGKLWWDLTRDRTIKREKLSEIIFYYLIRKEDLHRCVKKTVCQLWETLQKDERVKNIQFQTFDPAKPQTWFWMFGHVLTNKKTFDIIYTRLGNRPSAIIWLVKRKLLPLSNKLVEQLSECLPYEDLHNIFMSDKDEQGQTPLFYSRCSETYLKLHANRVEDLYKLLLIKDKTGRTALHVQGSMIVEALFNPLNIENHWDKFNELLSLQDDSRRTPMFNFAFNDGSDLLVNLYKNRTVELYSLLAIQDINGKTALFTNMYDTIKKILHKTYDAAHHRQIVNLLRLRDKQGQTFLLSDEIRFSNYFQALDLFKQIFTGHNNELYEMLSIQDINGQTVLFSYNKEQQIYDLLTKTYLPKYFPQLIALLSIQDNEGQTHLFHTCDIDLYVEWFAEHVVELCAILSIQDNNGRTAIHHEKSEQICHILSHLYSFQHREDFQTLLLTEDKQGKTPLKVLDIAGNRHNRLSELLAVVKNNRYMLKNTSQVLLFYFTRKRPWAKEEAQALSDVMNLKSARIERDKREYEIIKIIKESVHEGPSALIVFILSHGKLGYITDCDDEDVQLSSIEEAMCENSQLEGRPKILITQCCQIGEVSESTPPYAPTHDHFFAAMSCAAGQPSIRGLFTSKLTERIKMGSLEEPISLTIANIAKEIKNEEHRQTPVVMDTLRAEFPLIKVLRNQF